MRNIFSFNDGGTNLHKNAKHYFKESEVKDVPFTK